MKQKAVFVGAHLSTDKSYLANFKSKGSPRLVSSVLEVLLEGKEDELSKKSGAGGSDELCTEVDEGLLAELRLSEWMRLAYGVDIELSVFED